MFCANLKVRKRTLYRCAHTVFAWILCGIAANIGCLPWAAACPISGGSTFDGVNGTPLNGQGGGDGSSPFIADNTASQTAFIILDGKAAVQTTDANTPLRISQAISNSFPSLSSYLSSAELMQMGANDTPQVQGVEYYDSTGLLTVAYGIKEDTNNNRQFYAQIGPTASGGAASGGGQLFTTSIPGGAVQPNTFYYMFGKMTNLGGGSVTLTVWQNPTWADVNSNNTSASSFVGQLNGFLGTNADTSFRGASIGNKQTLYAQGSSGTIYKTWDDLFVSSDPDQLALGRIQLTAGSRNTTGNAQPGFESFKIDNSPSNNTFTPSTPDGTSYRMTRNWADFGMAGRGHYGDTETIDVASLNNSTLNVFDVALTGGSNSGVADSLRGSGVAGTGGVDLHFHNLLADSYRIKTYHWLPTELLPSGASANQFTIWSQTDGLNWINRGTYTPGTNTDVATEIYTSVLSDGIHDVYLRFLPSNIASPTDIDAINASTMNVGLNAFFIVPEPGTMALLCAGLAGFGAWTWRRSRSSPTA